MQVNQFKLFQSTGILTQKFYNSSTHVWCLLVKVIILFPHLQENESFSYNHPAMSVAGET